MNFSSFEHLIQLFFFFLHSNILILGCLLSYIARCTSFLSFLVHYFLRVECLIMSFFFFFFFFFLLLSSSSELLLLLLLPVTLFWGRVAYLAGIKTLYLKHVITSVHINVQDCAGVILCAAERATQVALQVKKHQTDSSLVVYESQNFVAWTNVLFLSYSPSLYYYSLFHIQEKIFYGHLDNIYGLWFSCINSFGLRKLSGPCYSSLGQSYSFHGSHSWSCSIFLTLRLE